MPTSTAPPNQRYAQNAITTGTPNWTTASIAIPSGSSLRTSRLLIRRISDTARLYWLSRSSVRLNARADRDPLHVLEHAPA